jgi:hypothetical protein
MIVIDYSQIALAALMVDMKNNEELFRHKILNSIRHIVFKHRVNYGEVVIACDHSPSWRKTKYPFYKATRKRSPNADWEAMFKYMGIMREELAEYFPYKVLRVEECEADDIIGTLAKMSQYHDLNDTMMGPEPKPFLIVSRDSDFVQLQQYTNVKQYNNVDKKFIVPDTSAKRALFEKIVRGDPGDSICNILSPNDSFLTKTKQKPIKTALMDDWFKDSTTLLSDPAVKQRWDENQELIDLTKTPRPIIANIVKNYINTTPSKGKVMKYLMKHQMKLLIENAGEF